MRQSTLELHEKVAETLLERKMVSAGAVKAAHDERRLTGRPVGEILVKNGFIRHADLIDLLLEVAPELVRNEHAFVPSVPAEVFESTRSMIVAESADKLYVGTLSPQSIVTARIQEHDDREIIYVPASLERIENYIAEVERISANSEDSLLDRIIYESLIHGVSDIHIIPKMDIYSILFRYLGVRHIHYSGLADEYNTLAARIKDRSGMDLSERRVPQDGGFQVEYRGHFVDLRVATIPTVYGETIVIRVLDSEAINMRLDTLGISRVEDWKRAISRADGLCLICGPTGSGKTTTLNATVRGMDRFSRSIYTAEDPVEYNMPYVAQVNVNTAVGLDFARALRAFMRADPNVVILGEIRDEETSRNMLRAAETGHLVMATLHTGSIRGAVQRLQDLGVNAHELRYLLRGVLVQRLMRVQCTKCHGAGCKHCMNTGYKGRTIISECSYFNNEEEVDAMMAGKRNWTTLVEDAVNKYKAGETDRKEVERIFGGEAELYLNAV